MYLIYLIVSVCLDGLIESAIAWAFECARVDLFVMVLLFLVQSPLFQQFTDEFMVLSTYLVKPTSASLNTYFFSWPIVNWWGFRLLAFKVLFCFFFLVSFEIVLFTLFSCLVCICTLGVVQTHVFLQVVKVLLHVCYCETARLALQFDVQMTFVQQMSLYIPLLSTFKTSTKLAVVLIFSFLNKFVL